MLPLPLLHLPLSSVFGHLQSHHLNVCAWSVEAINRNRTYVKFENKTRADFRNLGWEKPAETIQRVASIQGNVVCKQSSQYCSYHLWTLSKKEYPNMRDNCLDEEIFLTIHGVILLSLMACNYLYQVLSIQMIGERSKHAELTCSNILTTFIHTNSQLLGSGRTIKDCTYSQHLGIVTKVGQYGRHAEIKAAASLC